MSGIGGGASSICDKFNFRYALNDGSMYEACIIMDISDTMIVAISNENFNVISSFIVD
jgi:hypothetical protein